MFIFNIEYCGLMDFGPYIVGLFLYEDFWKMIFWLVLKLEITYRVMRSWSILVSFRGFFWRLYFCMVKHLNFHNSSFALRYILFNINDKPTVWHTQPLVGLMDGWTQMNEGKPQNTKITLLNCTTQQLFKNSPSFHPQLLLGSRSGLMPGRPGREAKEWQSP